LVLAALVVGVYFARLRSARRLSDIGAAARALLARAPKIVEAFSVLTPEEIARRNAEALVTVETVWQLVDSGSGRRVKQIYIPNRREPSESNSPPLIPNASSELPVFVLLSGNRLRPLLTVSSQGSYQGIGGRGRSAGFVVASDRVVLTSRSATSPWRMPYDWPARDTAGIVAVFDEQLKLAKTAVITRRQFPQWIPENTDFVLENGLDQKTVRINSHIRGKGRFDSLTVRTSHAQFDLPLALVRESDETGIAAIRLDAETSKRGGTVSADSRLGAGDEVVMVSAGDGRPAIGRLTGIDGRGRYELAVEMPPRTGPGAAIFDRRGRIVAVQAETDPLRPNRAAAISIRRALESVGPGSALRSFSFAVRIAAGSLAEHWSGPFPGR
jgi:hypothetical protein